MYTIIITSSFRKSHPSIKMIKTLLKSLYVVTPNIFDNPIIIAQDYHTDEKYKGYLDNLKELLENKPEYKNVKIIYNDSQNRNKLSYNIDNAIEHITTKYVWILQDDFLLIKHFNIKGIIEDMENNKDLKLIRTTDAAVNISKTYDEKIDYEAVDFILNNDKFYFKEFNRKNISKNVDIIGSLVNSNNCINIHIASGCSYNDFTSWDYGPPFLDNKYDKKFIGIIKHEKNYNYISATLYSDQAILTTKEFMINEILNNEFRLNPIDASSLFSPEGWMNRAIYLKQNYYGIHILCNNDKPLTTLLNLNGIKFNP